MADALLWETLRALLPDAPTALDDGPLLKAYDVLDVGGGTGGLAVRIAALGHRVTVVDPSPDALAALDRRAGELAVSGTTPIGAVVGLQGDVDDLPVPPGSFDLVLCHGVLEQVDDPSQALVAVADTVRPGGLLSLAVSQRSAAVVTAALSGHLGRAQALLDDPDGRWGEQDNLRHRFDRTQVAALAATAGLQVQSLQGLRVLADLVPGPLLETDPTAPARLLALDAQLVGHPDYDGLAPTLHLLALRPG